MARVLFTAPMDAERRAIAARMASAQFEPVILEDLSAKERDDGWATADAVVCLGFPREFPLDLREKARKLRLVQALVAGVDHLPFERFPPAAIVCSNAGAYSVSVAEHAMALLLAAAKDIVTRTEEIRRSVFDQDVVNRGLAGSTALILGMGGIGGEIARRCKAFGMRVVGVTRSGRRRTDVADATVALEAVGNELPNAGAVILALPLTRATRGLVDRRFLAAMRDDAILVNIARGKLIDEDDLFEHLKAHPNFRAALDTWWTYPDTKQGRPFHRPFQDLSNVVMTPHVASMVQGQRALAMEAALQNVLRFLRGEKPHHIVDPSDYERTAPRTPSR